MPTPSQTPARSPRRRRLVALLTASALALAACSDGGGSDSSPTTTTDPEVSTGGPTTSAPEGTRPDDEPGTSPVQDGIRIEVISSQPDRVTGPEARVRVTPARDGEAIDLRVRLGEVDVTGQLTERDGRLEGVVTGLVEGNNSLIAEADGTSVTQRLRSWPLTGPMISGPHGPLLACSTEANGLGAPSDLSCSAPTRVSWRYIGTDGAVKDLPDPAARPADLATADLDGRGEVPLIVRYEVGVVNRSVYEVASLDPSPGGADSDQSDAVWNGRLLYRFGSGCRTTYGQGIADAEVLDPGFLEQGYALATATFNTGAVQCNDVVSAETLMMVKERVIEQFGEPTATIGDGAGFGAAQVHLLIQNYPGLLDGGVAVDPFPDVVTVASGIADCGLLNRYYRSPEGRALTPAQRAAVGGHATATTCDAWEGEAAPLLDPTVGCDPAIPATEVYDAATRPGGVRCTLQDGSRNQFGPDAATGFAASPLDNVGLQYGLQALNDGDIDFEQFVALNEAIGGWTLDGAHQAERQEAGLEAVLAAYETGRVSAGVGDQQKVPILEVSRYDDDAGATADHVRAFSFRDRATFGGPATSVPGLQIWTREATTTPAKDVTAEAIATVDGWLAAMEDDTGGGDPYDRLLRARPDAATDTCIPPGATDPVTGDDVYEAEGACAEAFPEHAGPRIAAGAPRSDDVLKCQLKPVDPTDYVRSLSEDQYTRLVELFPDGVCDWSAAGLGQTAPSMSDRTYEDVITPGELA